METAEQLYEYTKNCSIVHFKWVNFRFLNYISIKTYTDPGHEHGCQSSPVDTNTSQGARSAPPDPASSGEESVVADSGPWPLASSRANEMVLSANFKERKEEALDLSFFSF